MRTKRLEMEMSDMMSNVGEQLPRVKQIVRYVSKNNMSNPAEGTFSIQEIDDYVGSWVEKGYRLVNTHALPEAPENAIGMVYVLVRDAAV